MKIPIKKHTRVRRPMSPHRIGLGYYTTYSGDVNPVQDIKKVALPRITNPPYAEQIVSNTIDWAKQQKGDWKEWHEDMYEDMYKIERGNITGYTPYKSLADELNKPKSLLERITNKIRGK